MSRSGEHERIARLRAALAATDARLLVGIGDDAAVVAAPGAPLVLTIDAAVEGVHFRRDWMTLADVGYRATMAAASDLAAMGAEPLALLAALVLPGDLGDDELDAIALGQAEAARELGAPLAGGNLARGGELSITTTAIGSTPRPLLRSGARAGDAVLIAGEVGLSAAGRHALARGAAAHPALAGALAAFRRPRALVAEGLSARDVAHAAIDVSDGLAQDVAHLAHESGVSIVLESDALVTPALAQAAAALGEPAQPLALDGGEDYAIVVAVPEGSEIEGFRRIGRAVPRAAFDVALSSTAGLEPLAPRGHDHFRDP